MLFCHWVNVTWLWSLLLLVDLPVHPESFLSITRSTSWSAVRPCHRHVESWLYTGWNAHWWTTVCRLQRGILVSSNIVDIYVGLCLRMYVALSSLTPPQLVQLLMWDPWITCDCHSDQYRSLTLYDFFCILTVQVIELSTWIHHKIRRPQGWELPR